MLDKDCLSLKGWTHSMFFRELSNTTSLHPIVKDVEAYIDSCHLDGHTFFKLAAEKRKALELWVTQEIVMTNSFSQIVLMAAAQIQNVHLRSMMAEIAFGEHGVTRGGLALGSHPYLLDKLRISLDIAPSDVKPRKATEDFLDRLYASLNEQITAVAAIGSGNERLIVPEYKAIKRCFESLCPNAVYEPFLQANLNEDIYHSKLCYIIASEMIASGSSPDKYLSAAINSIDSRVQYFDELACSV